MTEDTILYTRCAWCGNDLGSKPGEGATGITPDICDACLAEMFASEKITARGVLRGLAQSALIVLGIVVIGLLARGYFDGWLGRLW
jgi:hypothetical protein